MPSSPLLGRTVVDDPQGLFKKHREEEPEERRKLYWSAPLPLPDPPREPLTLPQYQCLVSFPPQVG